MSIFNVNFFDFFLTAEEYEFDRNSAPKALGCCELIRLDRRTYSKLYCEAANESDLPEQSGA